MKRIMWAASLVAGITLTAAGHVAAQGWVPLVNSAVVDYGAKTLTISGTNFGTGPTVTLGTVPLGLRSASPTQIVTTFPAACRPQRLRQATTFSKWSSPARHWRYLM